MSNPKSVANAQRGLSESVQWAVLGTVALVCLLALMEAAVVLHGRNVAAAAALTGAQAQALLNAQEGVGVQVATQTAASGGLTDIQVVVSVEHGLVTVRVDATVPALTGWTSPHVSAVSTRPMEAP